MSRPPDNTDETPDDAVLSAYLDGELPRAEAERLTARLAADPALSGRLEKMQRANLVARRAFEAADDRPLPQGVLDLLKDRDTAPGGGDGQSAAGVVPFPFRGTRRYWQLRAALAASVALVVGFLLGDLLHREPAADTDLAALYAGAIGEGSGLHRVLEYGVSSEPAELPDGAEARLLLTFESEDGDWCRQLQLTGEYGSLQALACRRDGVWRMEAAAFGSVPGSGDPSGYRTASGASLPALDAAIEARIGDRPPLGPEEESVIISSSWKKSGEVTE